MGAYLICEDGPTAGTIVSFIEGDEWVLGRDPDTCFHVIEDPMVSRRHAVVRVDGDHYTIENLSEVNPVLLNDEPVDGTFELHEEDTLQIGNNYFRFTFHNPEESPYKEEGENRLEMGEGLSDDSHLPPSLSRLPIITPSDKRFLVKVISGPNQGAEFGMNSNESYVIGKDPRSSDIIFQDLSVSRQHARIGIDSNGELTIEDLGSRNGVLVNGSRVEGTSSLTTQDLISTGTTSFLIIDREGAQDTIYSPPPPSLVERDLEQLGHPLDSDTPIEDYAEPAVGHEAKSWKETFIPTRHLFLASLFSFILFVGVVSLLALFRTQTVVVDSRDESKEIEQVIEDFQNVQYSYNPQSGRIFLLGHVLTEVEHSELIYLVHSLPFVIDIEDNVVIDEGVWESMNALLAKNPLWRSVMVSSTAPGRFVLRGYVEKQEEANQLREYVNLNFPYLNLLSNQVVAEDTLEKQVNNLLIEHGFVNVTQQFSGGELILAGRVNGREESSFHHLVDAHIKTIAGVRQVRDFVIFVSESTARIDLSDKYRVTGTSKFGEMNKFVLINGKILAKGDQLDGMVITAVTSDEVQLDQGGIKYKISYQQ